MIFSRRTSNAVSDRRPSGMVSYRLDLPIFRTMPLSTLYSDLLEGSYDCVDRVVLNAYFGMGQTGGGLRVWWRGLYGSDETLDDNHLMRMAGRFSRRLRAWRKRRIFR
jgi:hypothetical protein